MFLFSKKICNFVTYKYSSILWIINKGKETAQGCFSVDSPHSYPHRLTKYLSTTEHEERQVVDTMHLSTQSFDF